MSDLSKYCVHLLGIEGLGPVRGGFPISIVMFYTTEAHRGQLQLQTLPISILQCEFPFHSSILQPSSILLAHSLQD